MKSLPLSRRAHQALRIISNPQNYKICEGCDSIVTLPVFTCPNCHGYRFTTGKEKVTDQAQRLANREQQSVTAEDLLN